MTGRHTFVTAGMVTVAVAGSVDTVADLVKSAIADDVDLLQLVDPAASDADIETGNGSVWIDPTTVVAIYRQPPAPTSHLQPGLLGRG